MRRLTGMGPAAPTGNSSSSPELKGKKEASVLARWVQGDIMPWTTSLPQIPTVTPPGLWNRLCPASTLPPAQTGTRNADMALTNLGSGRFFCSPLGREFSTSAKSSSYNRNDGEDTGRVRSGSLLDTE